MLTKFSCLYHVLKILLYRPTLSRRWYIPNSILMPDPNHLVECIKSATSIIAIYDLFCRSFGDGHCILSLSYSVFTAASVFLLQIQALTSQDERAIHNLEFCIHALQRVVSINPGKANSNQIIGLLLFSDCLMNVY